MTDHSVLFPKPVVVRLNGRPVTVMPVKLENFSDFSDAATGLIELLADATPLKIYAYAKNSGALRAVLGSCTSLSSWRIRRLPAATAIELMVHVLRVNSGFFGKALLAAATQLAGPISSSN